MYLIFLPYPITHRDMAMAGYRTVCEAKTKEAMQAAFETILEEIAAQHGGTKESHRATQLANVGYFSGYYGQETLDRVHEWLGASHPIFGIKFPSATEAIEKGKRA